MIEIRRNILHFILFAFVLLPTTQVAAQSYSSGMTKYQAGDIVEAENEFFSALNNAKSATQKAKIYKMLGVCQFMLGDKGAGLESFRKALKLNPKLTLKNSEVLDTSIVSHWDKEKSKYQKKKPKPKPKPRPIPRRPTPKPSLAKLVVTSNVSGATIRVAGVVVGKAGQTIKTRPGPTVLQVEAPGYPAILKQVTLSKNKTNRFTIILNKPSRVVPIPTPQPRKKVVQKPIRRKPKRKEKITLKPDDSNFGVKEPKKRKRPPAKHSVALSLLPFGIGQYMHGDHMLGAFFTVSQLGFVYYWFSKNDQVNSAISETNATIDERIAHEKTLEGTEKDNYIIETDNYIADQEKTTNDIKNQMYIGAAGFGAMWLVSTIEGLIKHGQSQKKKRKKKSGFALTPQVDHDNKRGTHVNLALKWSF